MSADHQLEFHYWANSPLDSSVCLFNMSVEVATSPALDLLQFVSEVIPKPVGGIIVNDGYRVRLAPGDHSPFGSA
jgi:hypothetical protein